MLITKDSPEGRTARVMKDGKQVGLCLAIDTVTLEYVQAIPVAWGPDWKWGDDVPQPQESNVGGKSGFRFVVGKADEVVVFSEV